MWSQGPREIQRFPGDPEWHTWEEDGEAPPSQCAQFSEGRRMFWALHHPWGRSTEGQVHEECPSYSMPTLKKRLAM